MAFHCAAPNPLRAFLSTLVGILSPTYCHRGCVIWLHPHITVHFPRSPCSRHAGLCSVPQTSSFPPPDLCTGCSGYIKHPTPPLQLNIFFILHGLIQGSSDSLKSIYLHSSEYLPRVVIIYLIVYLLRSFFQLKMY